MPSQYPCPKFERLLRCPRCRFHWNGSLEEDGLRRFQAGELNPADEEWHKLVPESVRDSFGKNEVQRQSVIFEVIKSEKDYVGDLEALRDVSLLFFL